MVVLRGPEQQYRSGPCPFLKAFAAGSIGILAAGRARDESRRGFPTTSNASFFLDTQTGSCSIIYIKSVRDSCAEGGWLGGGCKGGVCMGSSVGHLIPAESRLVPSARGCLRWAFSHFHMDTPHLWNKTGSRHALCLVHSCSRSFRPAPPSCSAHNNTGG